MRSANGTRLIAARTGIGWIGVAVEGRTICQVRMGFPTRAELLQQFEVPACRCNEWESELAEKLKRFAAGKQTSLRGLRIDDSGMTPFQRRVTAACRQIPWGETLTYGQLAEVAGSPGASRAVGSVMANNRFPLIIPCHRVVGSQGIGGFSAPDGLNLKRRLLDNESTESVLDQVM